MKNNNLLDGIPRGAISPELEKSLIQKMLSHANRVAVRSEARTQLVLNTMWEAFFYVRECARGRLPDPELFSLAYKAAQRAAENFRPRKGCRKDFRFFLYVKPYLRGEISREFRRLQVVRSPKGMEMKSTVTLKIVRDHHDPCCDSHLLSSATNSVNRQDPEQKFCPAVGVELSTDMSFEEMDIQSVWSIIQPELEKNLTPQAHTALKLFYFEGLNYQEIGDKMGFARQYAQRIVVEAIKKLRCVLTQKGASLSVHEFTGA